MNQKNVMCPFESHSYFLTTNESVAEIARNRWEKIIETRSNYVRRCDSELFRSILFCLEVQKIYLDPSLNLLKFSHIVGTNTTYLSNAINKYFNCNLKNLINLYRVKHARYLLDCEHASLYNLHCKCGFISRSVFYTYFKKVIGVTPFQYALTINQNA